MATINGDRDDPRFKLSVRAIGPATEGGSIPLAELARIAGGLQAALDRLALAIRGRPGARGRRPSETLAAVQLDIIAISRGSVVLETAKTGQGELFDNEILESSLEALGRGVAQIAEGTTALPQHFTPALVNGLRELAGGIAPGKLTRLDVERGAQRLFSIDQRLREGVKALDIRPSTVPATVVGRLHMGDFSPASLRCRVDTYAGSILCDFDLELKDAVLDAMDCMVMASGIAQLQPDGSTIRTLHLTEVAVLPSATATSLDELARQQGVGPLESADELVGDPIPDEEFDAFLEAIGRGPEREV